MRCFVELNYSPPLPVLCRCTSCRDDVVTMAAKQREGRREERDGEKEVEENKSRTKSSAEGRKKRTERTREGRGRRSEDQRTDKRRNADVCFHVAWPSNLLSSLHVATDLSVFESILPGHHRLHIIPLILCLICQFKLRLRPVMTDSSMEVQKLGCHFQTSSPPIILCIKTYPLPSPSHNWIKLGGHTHVSFNDWIVCWHFTQCELCQGFMFVRF